MKVEKERIGTKEKNERKEERKESSEKKKPEIKLGKK